jgi:hypothetical protein
MQPTPSAICSGIRYRPDSFFVRWSSFLKFLHAATEDYFSKICKKKFMYMGMMGMMEQGAAMRRGKDDAVTVFLSGTHRDSMSAKRSTTKAGFENTQIGAQQLCAIGFELLPSIEAALRVRRDMKRFVQILGIECRNAKEYRNGKRTRKKLLHDSSLKLFDEGTILPRSRDTNPIKKRYPHKIAGR